MSWADALSPLKNANTVMKSTAKIADLFMTIVFLLLSMPRVFLGFMKYRKEQVEMNLPFHLLCRI
jgi:hypothetical protein